METADRNGGMVLQENRIEQRLRKEAKARGGLALKFVSPGMCGVCGRQLGDDRRDFG